MTKVMIDPGVCGFVTRAEAELTDEDTYEVKLTVKSGCSAVKSMMETLGDSADAISSCLVKPGCGPFYEYAKEHFPGHCACPVIAGITKAIEAECGLALKKDASIRFIEE
jgi:hypothetical protein